MVGIFTIGLLGLFIDLIFDYSCNRLMPWRKEEKIYVQG
jgi:ABC-type nitrate/sulfonate/bicarbonate transport system permease component